MRKRVLVVAPGRGTYTKESLGYLKKFSSQIVSFVPQLDAWRKAEGTLTVSELDGAESFKNHVHTKGENASLLIFSCSYADFLNLNPEKYEIVAVTGNSMGWYTTLALGGAISIEKAYEVVNTMGSMMKDRIIGGQVIYPIINEDWTYSIEKIKMVDQLLHRCNSEGHGEAHPSIHLGGYKVIGGDSQGLNWLLKNLPPQEHFPFQLINHAAFHTPLLKETSQLAFSKISAEGFQRPTLPMIDGRGHIWSPYSTDPNELYDYTLGHQVYEAYDFTKAITVGLKEFGPDQIVLLGPGSTLGGSIGQILVNEKWKGITSKSTFQKMQTENPFLNSLDFSK